MRALACLFTLSYLTACGSNTSMLNDVDAPVELHQKSFTMDGAVTITRITSEQAVVPFFNYDPVTRKSTPAGFAVNYTMYSQIEEPLFKISKMTGNIKALTMVMIMSKTDGDKLNEAFASKWAFRILEEPAKDQFGDYLYFERRNGPSEEEAPLKAGESLTVRTGSMSKVTYKNFETEDAAKEGLKEFQAQAPAVVKDFKVRFIVSFSYTGELEIAKADSK